MSWRESFLSSMRWQGEDSRETPLATPHDDDCTTSSPSQSSYADRRIGRGLLPLSVHCTCSPNVIIPGLLRSKERRLRHLPGWGEWYMRKDCCTDIGEVSLASSGRLNEVRPFRP